MALVVLIFAYPAKSLEERIVEYSGVSWVVDQWRMNNKLLWVRGCCE